MRKPFKFTYREIKIKQHQDTSHLSEWQQF